MTTLSQAIRETARRTALALLGVPVLDCDECGGECYEARTTDAGRLCIQCVEAERADEAAAYDRAIERRADADVALAYMTRERDEALALAERRRLKLERGRADVEAAFDASGALDAMTRERDELRVELDAMRKAPRKVTGGMPF